MNRPRTARIVAGIVTLAGAAFAQQQPEQEPTPAAKPPEAEVLRWLAPYFDMAPSGDYQVVQLAGGLRLQYGVTEFRAASGVVRLDLDAFLAYARGAQQRDDLPRRGALPPPPRRVTTSAEIARRLQTFLGAAGAGPDAIEPNAVPLDLVRTIYLEGDVVVVHAGVEVVRCARLHLSAIDDRAVFEDVTLRLRTLAEDGGEQLLTVRGPKLVRQGARTVGRDVTVTTSRAGDPHFAISVGQVEIIERGHQFEVRSRGNQLVIWGVRLLPLPNTSMFTGEQPDLPVRSLSGGYSNREGWQARAVLGGTFNRTGGALHEALTGRPADEFRGEYSLGAGWIQERGYPFDLDVDYRAADLYRGRVHGFYLDDQGEDLGTIQTYLDGTPITETERTLVQTENRFRLGERTEVDLTLFAAGDPAVWSEFHEREYREAELPETSAILTHRHDNLVATVGGRWNLNEFAYGDDLRLAPSFKEELPLATLDWFSQPLADLPFASQLLLTSSTSAGELRNAFDPRSPFGPDQESTRFDQLLELAAPLGVGPVRVRPYLSGRYTHYGELATTRPQAEEGRFALEAGIAASTRLTRSWLDADGNGIRHVVTPALVFANRFDVTGQPSDYIQFDAIDAIDEQAVIRIELLQRLQRVRAGPGAVGDPVQFMQKDYVWLDLAQIVTPISAQNGGSHLGLFEYELLLRPWLAWAPLPNLWLLVEGEHDWDQDHERTFNTGIGFGPVANIDWFAEWRTDHTTDGAIGAGASTRLLGRWFLGAGTQWDLDRDEWLAWSTSITRSDLDWTISLGVDYSVITDETRLFIQFEPTLGGVVRSRRGQWSSASRFVGATQFADY